MNLSTYYPFIMVLRSPVKLACDLSVLPKHFYAK